MVLAKSELCLMMLALAMLTNIATCQKDEAMLSESTSSNDDRIQPSMDSTGISQTRPRISAQPYKASSSDFFPKLLKVDEADPKNHYYLNNSSITYNHNLVTVPPSSLCQVFPNTMIAFHKNCVPFVKPNQNPENEVSSTPEEDLVTTTPCPSKGLVKPVSHVLFPILRKGAHKTVSKDLSKKYSEIRPFLIRYLDYLHGKQAKGNSRNRRELTDTKANVTATLNGSGPISMPKYNKKTEVGNPPVSRREVIENETEELLAEGNAPVSRQEVIENETEELLAEGNAPVSRQEVIENETEELLAEGNAPVSRREVIENETEELLAEGNAPVSRREVIENETEELLAEGNAPVSRQEVIENETEELLAEGNAPVSRQEVVKNATEDPLVSIVLLSEPEEQQKVVDDTLVPVPAGLKNGAAEPLNKTMPGYPTTLLTEQPTPGPESQSNINTTATAKADGKTGSKIIFYIVTVGCALAFFFHLLCIARVLTSCETRTNNGGNEA